MNLTSVCILMSVFAMSSGLLQPPVLHPWRVICRSGRCYLSCCIIKWFLWLGLLYLVPMSLGTGRGLDVLATAMGG